MARYLSFDLETAKLIPEGVDFDLQRERPLGITCAATMTSDSREVRTFHGADLEGRPTPKMSPDDLAKLIDHLAEKVADGYQILTWNGLGFDFDVLAEESCDLPRCSKLAGEHVDMMFHVVCTLGYRLGLEKAAIGLGLPGKTEGMSGGKAPELWAAGRHDEVLTYVRRDVELAMDVAEAALIAGRLKWITQRGRPAEMRLFHGWLSVPQAMQLPLPDTSWMSDPPTREGHMRWMTAR